jgi:hypothetical protein
LLGKSVLNGDILSLNPTELAQLLPKHVHEHSHTRSSAWIQETDTKDFSRLLRLGEKNIKQKDSKRKADNNTSTVPSKS